MKTTKQLLAEVRAKIKAAGVNPSKYRIAKEVGVSEETITNWDSGRTMDDESAAKVADYLGYKRREVLVWMACERAKSPAARKEWQGIAKALAGTAVAILVGGSALAMAPQAFDISHGIALSVADSGSDLYIMRILKVGGTAWLLLGKTALCAAFLTWLLRTFSARLR